MRFVRVLFTILFTLPCVAAGVSPAAGRAGAPAPTPERRLPTGAHLDPVVPAHKVGNFPLAMVASPDGTRLVVLLCGWREEGIQVIDRKSGAVLQTLDQPAAFIGLTFSPDGRTLYASGGNDDSIFVYRWLDGRAEPDGKIIVREKKKPKASGTSYPAGLACSPDGRYLYAAENLGDSLAVIDLARRAVVQRMNTERYPYAVVASANGVYVSCWGDSTVDAFTSRDGLLHGGVRIDAGRHPSALLLHGSRLFATSATTDRIAVIDTASRKIVKTLTDPPPAGPNEGSTPNALAISADGRRLFVAEADNNAVAMFDVASGKLLGRVPVEWYPSALLRLGGEIVVLNAKGGGTAPNASAETSEQAIEMYAPPKSHNYTLGQLDGSILSFPEGISDLRSLTQRVTAANGWSGARPAGETPAATRKAKYPPFRHVIYIIKENRTYDQVLGDVPEGDGDKALAYFGGDVSPNHHALAARFGLFDRFFVNAEVSSDGHNWCDAAYATDYVEKTTASQYSGRGREFDYQGTNRGVLVSDEDDVNAPSTGYLWDLAMRKHISLRDYGEFVVRGQDVGEPDRKSLGTKDALIAATAPDYVGWDLDVQDQARADAWIAEFNRYVTNHDLPAFEIMSLPNDHTYGMAANKPTPRAYVADNDLALGRIVDALSHSPYWRDTAVFVLEDDAQAGPDHVDSHRSVLLVISAYNRPGVVHRFTNTTDVIATMEQILGLGSLSQFDHYGRPLRGIFAATPDLTPYDAIKPGIDLNEKNPAKGAGAEESSKLDFSKPDAADPATLNRILEMAMQP